MHPHTVQVFVRALFLLPLNTAFQPKLWCREIVCQQRTYIIEYITVYNERTRKQYSLHTCL